MCPRDLLAPLELKAAAQIPSSLCGLCRVAPLGCSGKVMGGEGEAQQLQALRGSTNNLVLQWQPIETDFCNPLRQEKVSFRVQYKSMVWE